MSRQISSVFYLLHMIDFPAFSVNISPVNITHREAFLTADTTRYRLLRSSQFLLNYTITGTLPCSVGKLHKPSFVFNLNCSKTE